MNTFIYVLITYACMLLWITLSATVIMLNKYILDPRMGGFPFPITLTCTHMAFCSAVAWILVRAGAVKVPELPFNLWLSSVVPVGALFAVTLWLGNAAYLYLSVSFVQMLKAAMPMVVYAVGCVFGIESLSVKTGLTMTVIVFGVIVASLGEILFVWLGVVLQMSSVLSESVRLTLVQILLQRKGIKLNPVSAMYYVSPVCLVCLLLPFVALEAPQLLQLPAGAGISAEMLAGSAVLAFCLNIAIFLLIGRSSALTMNVAGVVKDCLLIVLSAVLYKSPVTRQQVFGYGVAFFGMAYYNYTKIKSMAPPSAPSEATGKVSLASGATANGAHAVVDGAATNGGVAGGDEEAPSVRVRRISIAPAAETGDEAAEREPLLVARVEAGKA